MILKNYVYYKEYKIIHPVAFKDKEIRNKKDCFWGDMTKVPVTRLEYEDDIFPTAQSVIAELLRKNPNYTTKRGKRQSSCYM